MKILVHTCCAPCLIYPYEVLKNKSFEVSAFFYNPNIHPYTEYRKRKDSLKDYVQSQNIPTYFYDDYDIESFFHAVNNKEKGPQRCVECWRLRLKKTAEKSKELGFDSFTTTLLVSPYQDQKLIKEIGYRIAKDKSVDFYFEDFTSGFKQAHDKARELGLYLQKYCGCLYSERARYIKKYRKRK